MTKRGSKRTPAKKRPPAKRAVKRSKAAPAPPVKPKIPGKPGPRLNDEQKALLLTLLAAGQHETMIGQAFQLLGWGALASSTLSHYRKAFSQQIEEAKARRVDDALTTGLALKAERIAALKEHAEMLGALRFTPDEKGRLWNEKAWRETLADIAQEMGDRKPKEQAQEVPVKVYVNVDVDKV